MDQRLGQAVMETRQGLSMSMRGLARAARVSPGHLREVELGTRNPSRDLTSRIETALGLERGVLHRLHPGPDPDVLRRVRRTVLLLVKRGWTHAALSAELGVGRHTVRQWGEGSRPLRPERTLSCLEALLDRTPPPRRRHFGRHYRQLLDPVPRLRRCRRCKVEQDLGLFDGRGLICASCRDVG